MVVGVGVALDKQKNLSDINEFKVVLTNYNDKISIDVTPVLHSFSIFEDINSPVCTCELVIQDALGLLAKLPIIGEEFITIQYRTRGMKAQSETDLFPLVVRSFRADKIIDHEESGEKMLNFKLHGVDDHYHINEGIDINQSFVGSNCILAANSIFYSSFVNTSLEYRPFNKQEKLLGKGNASVKKSNNTSNYIAPGLTPFEVIDQLKEEAEHEEVGNPNDYVFFQNLEGIHLTTLAELKDQDPIFTYYLKDPNTEEYEEVEKGEYVTDPFLGTEKNIIMNLKYVRGFDHVENFQNGFYGNRVVGIDLLNKMYDERVESYSSNYSNLSTLEGPAGGALVSSGEYPKGFFNKVGSTHTRYIATELLSTSLDTGNPSNFSTVKYPSYSLSPYIYPIDKKDPDVKKDKVNGTLSNKAAREKQADVISKDPTVANPRKRHLFLNKNIFAKGQMNNIVINVIVPGNSALTVGQVINVFFPRRTESPKAGEYDQLYTSTSSAKFFVTHIRQAYTTESQGYFTTATIVKDSYAAKIDKIFETNNEEASDE